MVGAERAAKAQGPRGRHRRGARPLLQGGHRARDGRVPAEARARRSIDRDFAEFFARVEAPASTTYRGYTVYKHAFGSQGPMLLQTLNILENFDLRAMGYASADYLHTRHRGDEAGVCRSRHLLRGPGVREGPGRRAALEGVREGARGADRSEAGVEGVHRRRPDEVRPAGEAVDRTGRPTSRTGPSRPRRPAATRWPRSDRIRPASRRTRRTSRSSTRPATSSTSTPSGGWIGGAVILGGTGIGMSVRGEQFWLDKTKADPAPSARAAALHVDAEPRLKTATADDGASARPAATTRIRRSSRPSSASSSSGTRGIRTCTRRSSGRARRRSTSTARSGRTAPGFNKLNVEATDSGRGLQGAASHAATT